MKEFNRFMKYLVYIIIVMTVSFALAWVFPAWGICFCVCAIGGGILYKL